MNPETGRITKVPNDSYEAIEWPTSAEYRATKKKRTASRKKIEKEVERVAERAFKTPQAQKAAASAVAKATGATRAVSAGAAKAGAVLGGSVTSAVATLGVAGTAAAVAAAGALGYAIGTAGVKAWRYLQPAERDYRKAQAIRKARQDWEWKNGRAMTSAEHKAFYRGFTDSLSTRS